MGYKATIFKKLTLPRYLCQYIHNLWNAISEMTYFYYDFHFKSHCVFYGFSERTDCVRAQITVMQ